MITCINIDNIEYLKNDLAVKCWTNQHLFILLTTALPIFIIWIVGYPLIITILLKRNIHSFNDNETIVTYGFYYTGLTDKIYYWDIIIVNLRKILLSAIVASLST